MVTIKFNVKARRFVIAESGKFIKEATVLELLDNYRTQKMIEVDKAVSELIEKKDYQQFLTTSGNAIKDLHFVNYVVGKGGIKALNNSDIEVINKQLRNELLLNFDPVTGSSYGLEELVTQLENDEISNAQFNARLKSYARGSRKSYWKGIDSRQDLEYVIRNLNGDNHCVECISYAALGAVKRQFMPLPGEACSCRSNCLCSLSYLTERQYKNYLSSFLGNARLEESI